MIVNGSWLCNILYLYLYCKFSPMALRLSRSFMNMKVLEQILRIVAMVASAIAGYLSHDSISTLF